MNRIIGNCETCFVKKNVCKLSVFPRTHSIGYVYSNVSTSLAGIRSPRSYTDQMKNLAKDVLKLEEIAEEAAKPAKLFITDVGVDGQVVSGSLYLYEENPTPHLVNIVDLYLGKGLLQEK